MLAIASLSPSSALSLERYGTSLFVRRLLRERQNREIVSVCFIAPGSLCLNPPLPGYTKGTLSGVSWQRGGSVPAR